MKVGFLVSYDYAYLPTAISAIYDVASKIYLALDINLRTWTGKSFIIEEEFYRTLENMDPDKKIVWIREDFFKPDLTPMQCETRERNILLKAMGRGWKLQLDSDEYIVNARDIERFYKKYKWIGYVGSFIPISIQGTMITLFKKEKDQGFFYIEGNERIHLITNFDHYDKARSSFNTRLFHLPFLVLHQSWARTNNEIKEKIASWGHINDFDTQVFYNFWNSINETNYFNFVNFHPIKPEVWPKLLFIGETQISRIIEVFSEVFRESTHHYPSQEEYKKINSWIVFRLLKLPILKIRFKVLQFFRNLFF